jgi:hypothetical protein
MTEPLDFTSVGRQRNAPPPALPTDRPRVGRGQPKVRIAILAFVAVVVVAIGGFALLHRNGKASSAASAVTLSRYCDLARQLDTTAVSTGAASSVGRFDGSAAAIGRLLQGMGPTLVEMESDAPSKIRGNVASVVGALRKASDGDAQSIHSSSFTAAIARINAYRLTSCGGGASSGDS